MTITNRQGSDAISGIYIVQLKNEELMPVTRDPKFVEICARVNCSNIKVGKANDLTTRRAEYWKVFDQKNVVFETVVELDDIQAAETAILRALRQYRKLSTKGGKLEWLEGISHQDVKRTILATVDKKSIK